jgi:hypothetical protein
MSRSLAVLSAVIWFAALLQIPAVAGPRSFAMDDLIYDLSSWNLFQSSKDGETNIVNLESNGMFLGLYAKPAAGFNMRDTFASGSTVLKDESKTTKGNVVWSVLQTKHEMSVNSAKETSYVTAFSTVTAGKVYYGYVRASSADASYQKVNEILDRITLMRITPSRSLTDGNYRGVKYYLGWGAAMSGDPSMMHNEVKYDVQHTHDIFSKDVGGSYTPTKFIGPSTSKSQIAGEWTRLTQKMTSDDMYVQYSSGHGSQSALAVGVTYNEMRDAALAMPAKEIIIFTMACYSGNLVNSFNNKKTTWQDWGSKGRTLMVMASSKASEESATGPGTDKDESGGPSGSAGSAFGHALWKALIGYADGFVDGVKDGYISLGEIEKFTISKTQSVGSHTPVVTGVYKSALVMNRVPSKAFLAQLEGSTEGLSDEEVMERIQALDAELKVK